MQRGTSSIGSNSVRRSRPAVGAQIQRVQSFRSPAASPFVASSRPRQPFDSRSQQQRLVAARGLFGLGVPELVVIAGVAALIFGPSKLPELGKGLGKTVKSFQTAAKEFESELKQAAASDDGSKPADGAAQQADEAAKKAADK